jgi:hypothetical protein
MTAMLSRLFLLACLLASPAAQGQTYPDRNVTIVVTSAAGALTDTLTRAVAQRLSEMWKQNVIVENRGGAGYSIAAQSVMRAEHDGYTLLASETGFYTTQPHLYSEGKLAYDAEKDFVPVAGYGHYSDCTAGESVCACEFGDRPDRARQEEARGRDVRHGRRRHRAAHRRAGAGESHSHQDDGGALSWRGSRTK